MNSEHAYNLFRIVCVALLRSSSDLLNTSSVECDADEYCETNLACVVIELASRASRPRTAVGVPAGNGISKRRNICSGRLTGGFVDVAERLFGGRWPAAVNVGALERDWKRGGDDDDAV